MPEEDRAATTAALATSRRPRQAEGVATKSATTTGSLLPSVRLPNVGPLGVGLVTPRGVHVRLTGTQPEEASGQSRGGGVSDGADTADAGSAVTGAGAQRGGTAGDSR
jgi:hypothetical protein